MRTVVAEQESNKEHGGVRYGYTIYRLNAVFEREYEVVIHARTYDGIRVASQWHSQGIYFEADTRQEALGRGITKANEYVRALVGS